MSDDKFTSLTAAALCNIFILLYCHSEFCAWSLWLRSSAGLCIIALTANVRQSLMTSKSTITSLSWSYIIVDGPSICCISSGCGHGDVLKGSEELHNSWQSYMVPWQLPCWLWTTHDPFNAPKCGALKGSIFNTSLCLCPTDGTSGLLPVIDHMFA